MSTKPRLFWKLFGALFALSLVVLVSLAALIANGHERFVVQEQQQHLEIMARLAADEVAPVLLPGQETNLHLTVARLDQRSGARVTVIRGDGTVLADSRREASALESHADRPEVSQARAGGIGHARRYSTSTGMRMLYVAAPMTDQGAVIRLALPDQALQRLVDDLHRRVAQLVVVLLGVALVMAAWLSRQLSRPLLAMRQVACDLAEGRTGTVDWPQPDTRETAELAEALRRMSHRLREKIADVEQLLVEQKAVYASMVDGVLLVDRAGRVVELNRAAAQWFGCDPVAVRGRDILEVARHPRLDELVRRTLASPGPVEGDLVWHGPRDIHLQVHGAPVQPGPGRVAAVLVLTDVTRLRDMEKAHRDFVANASHELRTPVTAIKGFAENLAGDDLGPEQVKKFAGIVARQSDHLTTLIEDLLELTRLEHQREGGVLERENISVSSVLWAAVETCALEAQEKGMAISVKCPEELLADINVPLIQRAVTNLVDNAIKYSPPHTAIEVTGAPAPEGITLSVRDHGPGIAAEHRERIFERFYRVDKSRSRKLGGTGLGLSIVRHAADMHGGTVSVQSVVGEGSVFTLVLPPAAAP
jgi:two-component system phosphate regulon sensor histidine kinase PhoR